MKQYKTQEQIMSIDLVVGTPMPASMNINDNGTLGTPVILPDATTTTAGLMSANDKAKVGNSIQQDGNAFGTTMNVGTRTGDANNLAFIINGTTRATVTSSGIACTLGIQNNSSSNNARISFGASGTLITRNVADGNAALIVNQQNVGSTGNILILQKGGTEQLAVSSSGVAKFTNLAGTNRRMVTADDSGALDALIEVYAAPYDPSTAMAPTGTANALGFTFMRIGNIVTVTGLLSYTGATAGLSSIEIPIPVSSTFANNEDLVGVVTGIGLSAASPNYVIGSTGSNSAMVNFSSTSGAGSVYVQFQYQIL